MPCYSGTNNSQRALEWIGIGGYSSSQLWQAGTETDHAEGYRFWWEKVGAGGVPIQYQEPAVACGNYVDVEVDYNYSVLGKAYLWMQNYTNGQYWSHQESFVPAITARSGLWRGQAVVQARTMRVRHSAA